MEGYFLRLITYKGEWYDNKNYPCTEETRMAVAKELLHNNPKCCCCYYFTPEHNFYAYPIDRILVDEELPNDKDFMEYRKMYY